MKPLRQALSQIVAGDAEAASSGEVHHVAKGQRNHCCQREQFCLDQASPGWYIASEQTEPLVSPWYILWTIDASRRGGPGKEPASTSACKQWRAGYDLTTYTLWVDDHGHLSFRQLEVFVTVVETGSFQECSVRLNISQASVSNHVRALEAHIGERLFARRRGATSTMTEAGGRTYKLAKELITRSQDLLGAGSSRGEPRKRQRLTIGLHGFLAWVLAKPIAKFVSEHPEVSIVFRGMSYDRVVDSLGAGQIDVGYFFSSGRSIEIESALVWTEPVALFAATDHALSSLARVTPAQLAEHSLVALPSSPHLRLLVNTTLQKIGLTDFPVAFEAEDVGLAVEALCMGMGYACLFQRTMAGFSRRAHEFRRLNMEIPGIEVHQSVHRKNRLDPIVRYLTEYLSAEARSELRRWRSRERTERPGSSSAGPRTVPAERAIARATN